MPLPSFFLHASVAHGMQAMGIRANSPTSCTSRRGGGVCCCARHTSGCTRAPRPARARTKHATSSRRSLATSTGTRQVRRRRGMPRPWLGARRACARAPTPVRPLPARTDTRIRATAAGTLTHPPLLARTPLVSTLCLACTGGARVEAGNLPGRRRSTPFNAILV